MTRNIVMVALAMALFATPAMAQDGPLKAGVTAPKLEAKTWIKQGKEVKALSESDTKGKVVVLEFFAFW